MADNTYEADYAPNNRSKCKGPCKEQITKGELRLVKVHPSGFSDDKMARDYMHPKCMFQSFHRVKEGTVIIEKIKDISGLADLKKGDQDKIKKLFDDWKAGKIAVPSRAAPAKKAAATRSGKGTKRKREEKTKKPKGVFGGVVFAIDCSGRLAITDKIEANGGRVVGSITQNVTYVVTEDLEGKAAKLAKAKANGKKLVNVEWLDKKIKEGPKARESSSSSSSESEKESSDEEKEEKEEKGKGKGGKGGAKGGKGGKGGKKDSSDEEKDEKDDKDEKEEKGEKSDEDEESDEGPPAKKQKKSKGVDLSKAVICITGTFEGLKRDVIVEAITGAGGKVVSSVTVACTHVLAADPDEDTTKLKKARADGKKVVGIDFLGDLV